VSSEINKVYQQAFCICCCFHHFLELVVASLPNFSQLSCGTQASPVGHQLAPDFWLWFIITKTFEHKTITMPPCLLITVLCMPWLCFWYQMIQMMMFIYCTRVLYPLSLKGEEQDHQIPRGDLLDPTALSWKVLFVLVDNQAIIMVTSFDHASFAQLEQLFLPYFNNFSPYCRWIGSTADYPTGRWGCPQNCNVQSCLVLCLSCYWFSGALFILQGWFRFPALIEVQVGTYDCSVYGVLLESLQWYGIAISFCAMWYWYIVQSLAICWSVLCCSVSTFIQKVFWYIWKGPMYIQKGPIYKEEFLVL